MKTSHPPLRILSIRRRPLATAAFALIGSACLFTTASAQTQIAGLMDDGRVVLADGVSATFSSSRTDIATFSTNSGANPFVDVTFGGGLVYGLRDDGAVFSTDLSGNVSTVSTTGWGSVSRIDYANGGLFGLDAGTNSTILDTGGTARVTVNGFTAGDLGVRSNGTFSLMNDAASTFVYTYADGYSGVTSGFVTNGFTNFNNSQEGVTLEVNDALATVISINGSTGADVWRSQDGLGSGIVFEDNNVPNTISIALTPDNATAYFMEANNGTIRVADLGGSGESFLGGLRTGTGVGVVVIPEPASASLLLAGLAGLLVLRRRRS